MQRRRVVSSATSSSPSRMAPKAWSSEALYVAHIHSKVYQSPKLWYLHVTVIGAQELHATLNLPPLIVRVVRVEVQSV
ncbi:hypothetical protein NL676_038115 [Syzygium grande]|nr:hypothetical protein NL676_038115 [Syzygium grande]